jgi:3-oxoacyl-[acyl-carrier protein] reductase
MLNLSGKVALVTGASRGIGAAIAQTLATQGATVIAAARGTNAEATVAAILANGGRASWRGTSASTSWSTTPAWRAIS